MNKSIELIFENNWKELQNCGSCALTSLLEFFEEKNIKTFSSSLEMYSDLGKNDTICGAIIGINMAMSRILSNYDLSETEINDKMRVFREYFTTKFGSTQCFEILNEFNINGEIQVNSKDCQQKCHDLLQSSILKVMELLNEDTNPLLPLMNRYNSI